MRADADGSRLGVMTAQSAPSWRALVYLTLLLRTLTSSSSAFASSSRPSRLAPDAPEIASSRFNDAMTFKSLSVKYVVGFAEFIRSLSALHSERSFYRACSSLGDLYFFIAGERCRGELKRSRTERPAAI